jgi:hypothetical protein
LLVLFVFMSRKGAKTRKEYRMHHQLCELCALAALREIFFAPLREIFRTVKPQGFYYRGFTCFL